MAIHLEEHGSIVVQETLLQKLEEITEKQGKKETCRNDARWKVTSCTLVDRCGAFNRIYRASTCMSSAGIIWRRA
jgi:hypothetical protein